jgi:hypothetical protein
VGVTVTSGTSVTGVSFYDTGVGALGGYVFADINNNSAYNVGEGLSNVSVTVAGDLYGNGTTQSVVVATGTNGYWSVPNLRVSATGVDYTVTVNINTLPAGLTLNTVNPGGGSNSTAMVTLTVAAPASLNLNFGYRSPAVYSISGQVLSDLYGNGNLVATNRPIENVVVSLYSADGALLTTTLTTANGSYSFTNLIASSYVVVETDPAHAVSTADSSGPNDNRVPVTLVNANSTGNNFLDAIDPTGFLYDTADGRIVPGGLVQVTGPGGLITTNMDGSNGEYIFATDGTTGTYTIVVTPPPGYILDPSRSPAGASFDPTGYPDPTVLGAGESTNTPGYLTSALAGSNPFYYVFNLQTGDPVIANNNFPLKPVVIEIAGTVFDDLNGLTDDTVNGTGTDAGGLYATLVNPATHVVIVSVSVATNGVYRFDATNGVATNTAYEVILTQAMQPVGSTLTNATLPTGWVSTGEHVGAGPGSDGTVDGMLMVSTTADGVREVNFGIVKVPDVTPVITAIPNVMIGVTDFEIYVQCIELNGVNTTGLITLRIPKDTRWVMNPGWAPAMTQLPGSGLPVQNPLWTHTEDANTHFFTTTATIAGSSQATFGFAARWNAGQTRGSYTISVAIVPGSGGENRINNNNDAETVDYSF